LQWTPVKGLLFDLGAAWLNTKVLEWQAVSPTSVWPTVVRFDASGIELPQSPKLQLNADVEYERQISGNLKMRVGVDGNYKGTTSGGAQGAQDATDSYAIFNARVGLGSASDNWMVTLWARNLANRYYYPAAYQGGNGPWVRSVGMPRTIGVTGQYKF